VAVVSVVAVVLKTVNQKHMNRVTMNQMNQMNHHHIKSSSGRRYQCSRQRFFASSGHNNCCPTCGTMLSQRREGEGNLRNLHLRGKEGIGCLIGLVGLWEGLRIEQGRVDNPVRSAANMLLRRYSNIRKYFLCCNFAELHTCKLVSRLKDQTH